MKLGNEPANESMTAPGVWPIDEATLSNSKLTELMAGLTSYLQSWETDKGLAGIIATLWGSTVKTAEPHPMNQAPIIIGALKMHEAKVGGPGACEWLSWAKREGLALIGNIDEEGLLSNGWGDLPGDPKAPVIGFAAAEALFLLANVSGEDVFLQGADRILRGYEEKFGRGSVLSHGVVNQAARWSLARLARFRVTKNKDDLDKANSIGQSVLEEIISAGGNSGGIYQGRYSDRLIAVYVGKCIYPLMALYEATGDERYHFAAQKVGGYMLTMESDAGLFSSHATPKGSWYSLFRYAAAFDRKFLSGKLQLYKLRRMVITEWDVSCYPVFIARSADTLRGLAMLAVYSEEFREPLSRNLKALLSHQLPNYSYPNTLGFYGDSSISNWQDITSPTRWNAYVFQLFSELIVSRGITNLNKVSFAYPVTQKLNDVNPMILEESQKSVSLYEDTCERKLLWRINKATGQTTVDPAWKGGEEGCFTNYAGSNNGR